MRALSSLIAAVVCAAGATAAPALSAPTPQIAGCQILPATSAWNQPITRAPVARNSATLIRSIGLTANFHADFGSGLWDGGPIGIPFTTVTGNQPKVKVTFDYSDESDRGPYPIPPRAAIEGGSNADGDRHVIVLDRSSCKLYELFDAHPLAAGSSWRAGSGAVFDLHGGDAQRKRGWTSADAAGLPILPGLARYEEVAAGAIDHALRFTAPRTRASFIAPARHFASSSNDAKLPPMGLRVRLKHKTSLKGLPPQARVIAQAMKTYGLLLADNGSPWYVSGAPSPRWDNDQLHSLDRLSGRDFEVVQAPAPGVTR
ncbi:hypothetical protein [Conexibacter sp. CPCC 206217]|uniref:hypothetical protein n=1 Tax=Conexibacter sp. CPCC 206217 TaxID=3064574 RepID=UPI00271C8713|nr:hypothetical protein [Conexibacter sp. CPCC 206217]MDO8210729.1 hypothetical protein [Conexibacter sp. CPCC 206217]